jgi:hypothetical protein
LLLLLLLLLEKNRRDVIMGVTQLRGVIIMEPFFGPYHPIQSQSSLKKLLEISTKKYLLQCRGDVEATGKKKGLVAFCHGFI